MATDDLTRAAEALIDAFREHLGLTEEGKKQFGSRSLRVLGISDGSEGVQWNAWVDWTGDAPTGFAGVNLEGKEYDGWPVGRLIQRELSDPELPQIISGVSDPQAVQVLWYRDAWQMATRPPIREKMIGPSPVTLDRLTPQDWRAMLAEAAECLGPGLRGRGRQIVTVKAGQKEFPVSPHLQFRVHFRPFNPFTAESWLKDLDRVLGQLDPLHRFTSERAAR